MYFLTIWWFKVDSVDRTVARVRLQLVTMAPKKKARLSPPAKKTRIATVTPKKDTGTLTANESVEGVDLGTVAEPGGAKAPSKFDMLGFQKANYDSNTINGELLEEYVSKSLAVIRLEEGFGDFNETATVLGTTADEANPTAATGFMAPYDEEVFRTSMSNNNKHTCGMPLGWTDFYYSPQPGVRLSKARLDAAVDRLMALPLADLKTEPLLVGLLPDQLPHHGHLCVLSPEENRIPMLVAVAKHIEMGVSEDERHILKKLLYCVQVSFVNAFTDDERFFLAITERREISARASRTKRSATQIVDEIMSYWHKKEEVQGKMTADNVFLAYKRHCGDDEGTGDKDPSMNVTKSTILMAALIHKHILCKPKAVDIIAQGEILHDQSPFSGLTTLWSLCVYKCDEATTLWIMTLMLDAALTDPQQVASWTSRSLNPKNSQGKLSVWAFKRKLHQQLLQKTLPSFSVPLLESEKIVSTFADVSTFRSRCGYRKGAMYERGQEFRINFWQGLSENGELFVQSAEDLLLTDKFDQVVSIFLNAKGPFGSPHEFLQEQCLKDILTPVKMEAETPKAGDDEAPGYQAESGDELPPEKPNVQENPIDQKKGNNGKDNNQPVVLGRYLDGSQMTSGGMSLELAKSIVALKAQFRQQLMRNISMIVVDDTVSEEALTNKLLQIQNDQFGAEHTTVIVYDVQASGQVPTYPQVNGCPFQRPDYEKKVRAFLDFRSSQGGDGEVVTKASALARNDVFLTLDGGRPGNAASMKQAFTYLPTGQIGNNRLLMATSQAKSVKLVYEQDSVEARVGRLKNAMGFLHEGQAVHVVTAPNYEHEIKKRLHWESTTRYHHIFPIALPSHADAWRVTPKVKRDIFGANTLPTGVSSQTYIKAEVEQAKRGPNDDEPMNWFHMPYKLAEELLHDFSADRLVHLTSGDGWFMIASHMMRIPGIFLTFSKVHEEKVIDHVVEELFRLCQDPNSGWLHTSSHAIVKDIFAFKAELDKKSAKVSEVAKTKPVTPTKAKEATKPKLSSPAEGSKQKSPKITASHKKKSQPKMEKDPDADEEDKDWQHSETDESEE
jgi:hypothetical protein